GVAEFLGEADELQPGLDGAEGEAEFLGDRLGREPAAVDEHLDVLRFVERRVGAREVGAGGEGVVGDAAAVGEDDGGDRGDAVLLGGVEAAAAVDDAVAVGAAGLELLDLGGGDHAARLDALHDGVAAGGVPRLDLGDVDGLEARLGRLEEAGLGLVLLHGMCSFWGSWAPALCFALALASALPAWARGGLVVGSSHAKSPRLQRWNRGRCGVLGCLVAVRL